MKTTLRVLLLLLLPCLAMAEAGPVIVMTHPTAFQVKNIVEMYEKDVLPLKSLVLIGVYHEDELANEEEAEAYQDAFEYVKQNEISWVRFQKLSGRVPCGDLFGENFWTPQFRELLAPASGIIFTGGMDIPPALYGQGIALLTEPTTPARHLYEISLLFHLLGGERNPSFAPLLTGREDFPVLAICLGLQSLNVALGGTLVQDIPSEVYGQKTVEAVLAGGPDRVHSGVYLDKLYPNDPDLAPPFHRILLERESIFVRKMGFSRSDHPFVATAHHQAIARLAKGLRAVAFSMDGKIIEAVEHSRFPNLLGVQFHPERHTLYRKGLFQRQGPGNPLDFNPLAFLKAHPPSYEFHRAIWKWFGGRVGLQKRRTIPVGVN
ncbi:MAG: gamma-glutamyl-gamma-aminobutyrate hydrolase family protein [Candidatus Aminicenantes bacterium]|nr:gamma-glutamyl-gamma-aminobutyrate hydrolase family protein [Candidatus Aminicenantes bacterium]